MVYLSKPDNVIRHGFILSSLVVDILQSTIDLHFTVLWITMTNQFYWALENEKQN